MGSIRIRQIASAPVHDLVGNAGHKEIIGQLVNELVDRSISAAFWKASSGRCGSIMDGHRKIAKESVL
jgi:hypothetical protein